MNEAKHPTERETTLGNSYTQQGDFKVPLYGLKSHLIGKKQGIGEEIHDREAFKGVSSSE